MSLQPGSPASRSVPQENVPGPMTNATCGPQQSSASAWYDRATACWRTYQDSFLLATLEPFSETWPKAGMMLAGVFYPQPKWEPIINAKDYGFLLPTPTARDGKGYYSINRPLAIKRVSRARGDAHWIAHLILCTNLEKAWANPQFSEWIMGLPTGWTDLQPLAICKFQQWSRQFGNYWLGS